MIAIFAQTNTGVGGLGRGPHQTASNSVRVVSRDLSGRLEHVTESRHRCLIPLRRFLSVAARGNADTWSELQVQLWLSRETKKRKGKLYRSSGTEKMGISHF